MPRHFMDSMRVTCLIVLLAFAGMACDGGPSADAGDERADTSEPPDTAPTDGTSDTAGEADVPAIEDSGSTNPDGWRPTGAAFPISGIFVGEAELARSDDETTTHPVRATMSESAGSFRGLLHVDTADGERSQFQYVVIGELDETRTAVDLQLSARRCTSDERPSSCESGAIPDEPVFETSGTWTGGGFAFGAANLREGVPPEFAPVLESLTLGPGVGFGPGSGRRAPTGGFRPAGVDAGDPEPIPLPTGTTVWSGRATNAHVLDPETDDPIDCLIELDHRDGTVELTQFTCSEISLLDDPDSNGDAHVIEEGFATTPDRTGFGILVERGQTQFFFTARRQDDLISGVIVRRKRSLRTDPTPIDPVEPSASQIDGAFYVTRQ